MKMKARADPSSEFVLAFSQMFSWRLPGGSKGSQRPLEGALGGPGGPLGEALEVPGGRGVLRGHPGALQECLQRRLLARKPSKDHGKMNIFKNEGKKNTVFLHLLRPQKSAFRVGEKQI